MSRRFFHLWLGTLRHPLTTFDDLEEADVSQGAKAAGLAGLLWTVLLVWLAIDGHRPSGPSPVGAGRHYAMQAALMVPLLLAGWWLLSRVMAQLVRRLGGKVEDAGLRAALGFALGVPLTVLFILPDLLMYAVGGFLEMSFLLPLTGPITIIWMTVLMGGATHIKSDLSTTKSVFVAIAGMVLLGVLMGPIVR